MRIPVSHLRPGFPNQHILTLSYVPLSFEVFRSLANVFRFQFLLNTNNMRGWEWFNKGRGGGRGGRRRRIIMELNEGTFWGIDWEEGGGGGGGRGFHPRVKIYITLKSQLDSYLSLLCISLYFKVFSDKNSQNSKTTTKTINKRV